MELLLKKIISSFILPPGIFILILFPILLINKKRVLKFLIITVSILIYLTSIEPFSDLLIKPLEDYVSPYNLSGKVDVIAVLGGGTFSNSPDKIAINDNVKSSLYPDSFKRLYYTFKIYKKLNIPIIVSGGKIFKNNIDSESSVMKEVLISMGVPPDGIICDEKSKNTYENLLNIKKIMDSHNYINVLIVTSAYHMKRVILISRKLNIKFIAAPTDYLTDRAGYNFTSYLPRAFNILKSSIALKEYVGIIFYNLRYQ